MPYCTHCSAKIPAGRRYCYPHYQAALRDFTREQQQFRQAQAAWAALTPVERDARHHQAEQEQIMALAGAAGLVLGGLAWYGLAQHWRVDGLAGLCLLFAAASVCAQWTPLRQALGRLMRVWIVAMPALFMGALALPVLALISGWVAQHWQGLALLAACGVLGVHLWQEGIGAHHVSGEPQPPLEPQP